MAATAPVQFPALWTASRDGRLVEVQGLLDGGADIEGRGGVSECSPLNIASSNGHQGVVRLLIEEGANIVSRNNKGRTPDELAASRKLHQVVAILKAEALRKTFVAFAMGQHERLGDESWVQGLDPGVVRMVLEQV
jgi:hypothetical protein